MASTYAFGRNLMVLVALAAVSISTTACWRSSPPVSAPAPVNEQTAAPRSEVVSQGVGPDAVAQAFILAMRDDKPEAANALWAGPIRFESGFDAWRDSHGLEMDRSQDASRFPTPDAAPEATREANERLLDAYSEYAIVSGRLRLDRGDSMFQPGGMTFVVQLGRSVDDEWDVLGLTFDQ